SVCHSDLASSGPSPVSLPDALPISRPPSPRHPARAPNEPATIATPCPAQDSFRADRARLLREPEGYRALRASATSDTPPQNKTIAAKISGPARAWAPAAKAPHACRRAQQASTRQSKILLARCGLRRFDRARPARWPQQRTLHWHETATSALLRIPATRNPARHDTTAKKYRHSGRQTGSTMPAAGAA